MNKCGDGYCCYNPAGKTLACGLLAITVVVLAVWAYQSKRCFSKKTFSAIYVGMLEKDAQTLLGNPGWNASFGWTPLANGLVRPYFESGGVPSLEGEVSKGWADHSGVIVVAFKDGRVKDMFFSAMIPPPFPLSLLP